MLELKLIHASKKATTLTIPNAWTETQAYVLNNITVKYLILDAPNPQT